MSERVFSKVILNKRALAGQSSHLPPMPAGFIHGQLTLNFLSVMQIVPNFRVRTIPVLGTMPATFGMAAASYILCRLF